MSFQEDPKDILKRYKRDPSDVKNAKLLKSISNILKEYPSLSDFYSETLKCETKMNFFAEKINGLSMFGDWKNFEEVLEICKKEFENFDFYY